MSIKKRFLFIHINSSVVFIPVSVDVTWLARRVKVDIRLRLTQMLGSVKASAFLATFTPSHAHASLLQVSSISLNKNTGDSSANLLPSYRQQVMVMYGAVSLQTACQFLHTHQSAGVALCSHGNVRWFGPGSGSGLAPRRGLDGQTPD